MSDVTYEDVVGVIVDIVSEEDRLRQHRVTMNKPLEPWGHTRFHKTLALHIHRATRPASHSFRAANYGIMEDEESARKWDFEA